MRTHASETHVVDASWLKQLQNLYSTTGGFSRETLAALYVDDAVFIDPVHQVQGLQSMVDYFNHVYGALNSCVFSFENHAQTGSDVFISWTMVFSHPKLQNGNRITVAGSSHLKLAGKSIAFHRDYYDVGSMLYDNIPILGQVTRWIKRRLSP